MFVWYVKKIIQTPKRGGEEAPNNLFVSNMIAFRIIQITD